GRDGGEAVARSRVLEAAKARGDAVMAEVDRDRYFAYADALNEVALLSMLRALQRAGLFTDRADAHTANEILETGQVDPRHHRLLRRWLRALTESGVLTLEQGGRYTGAPQPDERALTDAWDRVSELQQGVDDGARELLPYFR